MPPPGRLRVTGHGLAVVMVRMEIPFSPYSLIGAVLLLRLWLLLLLLMLMLATIHNTYLIIVPGVQFLPQIGKPRRAPPSAGPRALAL